MQRKTAADFDQELLILFDAYVHGGIDRRGFLDRAQKFAVGGVTASMLLASLSPNFAAAQVVPKDDKRLKTEMLTYASPSGSGSMKGYLAMPANATGKLRGGGWSTKKGLTPREGGVGGVPGGGWAGGGGRGGREDFLAAAKLLKERPECSGKYGAVGFCYGGGMVHFLSTRLPDLSAGVPFYGNHPAAEDAAKVKAPLLIHFAGIDERINAAWPAYEAALKAAGARYTAHQYAGTQHGFNNDTTPRFDTAAAKLAWDRTLAFFNQTLRG